MKHDADVLERVLGIDEHPPNYKEVHTDVVDLEMHPSLSGSRPSHEEPPRSSRMSPIKGRRERS